MVYKKNLPPQLQNYEMVEDRLVRFWKHCPNGRLKTEVVEIFDNGDRVLMKATMWINREDSHPVSTGIAMDWKNKKGMVNSTNWIENTETSCLGRCISSSPFATEQTTARWLGMKEAEVGKLGKAPRPSREEMEIALGRQKQLKAEQEQPAVDDFYEKVKNEPQKVVPESDLREVEFRNFCEELVKEGKMYEKVREKLFQYIDQKIESGGMNGLEIAIDEAVKLGFDFNKKNEVEDPVTEPVKTEETLFNEISDFVEDCENKFHEQMVALNPDIDKDDTRMSLQVNFIKNQTLQKGRKNYQEGVDYWNQMMKKKPYEIRDDEIIVDDDVVQPEDLPSIMSEMGAEEVDRFEDFPTLVKKITYKNPDYQSSVKQQDLILKCCKFRNITPERLGKYLEQELKTSLTDLTIQEASWLIDGFFGEKKR